MDATNKSLLFAFSTLLGRLNNPVDYQTLKEELAGQDLNFDALAQGEYVHIVDRGGYGTWPHSNNAIIHFQYQDPEQPYIELENGDRDANIIDHYSIVHDYEQKQILDSADGVIKEPNVYGLPVSWAIFEAGSVPKAAEPKLDEERSYKVLRGGESGWDIARKLKLDPNLLREHNEDDFEDFSNIPEGTILHLPVKQTKEKVAATEFEFMRRGLEMHVSKEGGTRKYAFGNPRLGIAETGPGQPENRNVVIFAIAHVPINDEIRTFYMESGEVDVTGKKIKWAVGFAEDDLAEGHVEEPEVKPTPAQEQVKETLAQVQERKKADALQRLQMIEDVNAEDHPPSRRMGSDSIPLTPEQSPHNWWKTTYKPLNESREPQVFLFNKDIVVTDLGGQCKNRLLRRLDGVRISGTFTGPDHREYYRPQDAMDNFTWYGIPVQDPDTGEPVLISEDELYNTDLSLSERLAVPHGHGRLTPIERYFTVPLAKATAKSTFLRRYVDKVKQNKE